MTINDIEIWSSFYSGPGHLQEMLVQKQNEEKEISVLRYTHKAILTINVFAHKLVHCVKNLDTMAIGMVCTDRAIG